MAILLLLLCVYSVTGCLPVRYLAMLWPSTLQYSETWPQVIWHTGSNILEKRVASIFKVEEWYVIFQKTIILTFTAKSVKPQLDDDTPFHQGGLNYNKGIYILSCHPIHKTFVPVPILALLYFMYLSSMHLSISFLDFPMVIYSLSLFMMFSRNPCVPHVQTSVKDHVVQYKWNGRWRAKLGLLSTCVVCFRPWGWRQYVPLKCPWISTELQSIASREIVFIVFTLITSNTTLNN
jgi:hypothetical protein